MTKQLLITLLIMSPACSAMTSSSDKAKQPSDSAHAQATQATIAHRARTEKAAALEALAQKQAEEDNAYIARMKRETRKNDAK
jgi:hypothetical protein